MWQDHTIALTTDTGGAGLAAASGTTQAPVRGFIEAIQVDYVDALPATTDLTITEVGGMQRTILTLTNTNTDKILYPMVQATDGAGAAITGAYKRIFIPGEILRVDVAQGNNSQRITVRIYMSEY